MFVAILYLADKRVLLAWFSVLVQGKPADPAQLQVVGVQYYDILVLYGAAFF